ncbi:MAG: DinB family protein [Anaerolineaceae bacterium]|nr:DinB family protein [Anaerolineaceae bacterium]
MKNQSAVNNLRFMFEQLHGYLEGTMQNVDDRVARYEPGGPPAILGQYAHLVTGEDWFINVKLANRTPVMMSTNPGFQTPPPPTGWDEWARTEETDLAALRAYALKVYEATDTFLAAADDTILDQPVDLTEVGMGLVNGAAALFLAFTNVALHTGEISAIKGLNGLVGYPVAESVETAVV